MRKQEAAVLCNEGKQSLIKDRGGREDYHLSGQGLLAQQGEGNQEIMNTGKVEKELEDPQRSNLIPAVAKRVGWSKLRGSWLLKSILARVLMDSWGGNKPIKSWAVKGQRVDVFLHCTRLLAFFRGPHSSSSI